MTEMMRAIVLDAPGAPSALQIREVPRPSVEPGSVLIEVRAFGLNRSELHFRLGLGSFGSFPRIPGIEATGLVVEAPGGEFAPGQQVAALMGGMGRTIDGGYAEYVAVPAASVVPFTSDLDWAVLGAVPEMLQTAYGSLTTGVDAKPGDSLLIRGGTSSIGLALAVIAKQRGLTVLSTTRSAAKAGVLTAAGVDHVIIDDRRPGPGDPAAGRLRCRGARRHADPPGHPARDRRARNRVLHRHAERPVDRPGLLSH
jgi:NADPH2:quinone reductase